MLFQRQRLLLTLLDAVGERESLPRQRATLGKSPCWVAAGERVASMCFERLPQQCHRHCVAEALERIGGANLTAHHL